MPEKNKEDQDFIQEQEDKSQLLDQYHSIQPTSEMVITGKVVSIKEGTISPLTEDEILALQIDPIEIKSPLPKKSTSIKLEVKKVSRGKPSKI